MEKAIAVTEKQLGIKLVNTNTFNASLYKYMPFIRVIDMLKKGIPFVCPDKWHDPYEIRYLTTDFTNIGYTRPDEIYGFCSRLDVEGDEASWKMYSNGSDPVIRVRMNTPLLLQLIGEWCKKNNCNAYFTKVEYYNTNIIKTLHNPSNDYYKKFFFKF